MIKLTKPQKGIVSTSAWLHTNDGHNYKAFFGLCHVLKAEDVIGCKTGSGQADFVIVLGTKYPMIITGCQFQAFHACDKKPCSNEIFEVI